jgi:VWFA-related protein
MSESHRSRARVATRLAVAAVVVAVSRMVVSGADAPLTTADLVRFLRAEISERTILTELSERGFAEPLDASREASLRDAGASETLVVAVRRAARVEGAAAATPASRSASEPPVARAGPESAPTFAAGTRTVRVPVSVLDEDGKPVMGLRSEDFRVREDGRDQEVTLFSGERRPLRIALALDSSRSMEHKVREVNAALKHFIDLLEPEDEVMVITFSDAVRIVQGFTSDRERLGSVLDTLDPAGATALYDAAYEAIGRVAEGPAESKAVVLVTDGVDTASSTSLEDLRELARRSEVPVFSIGLSGMTRLANTFRPPRRPPGGIGGGPGPGGGGRWPGGGGRWPGGGGRGGWPGGGGGGGRLPVPGVPGGAPGTTGGFDAEPLLDLADDTGGRAEILRVSDGSAFARAAREGDRRLKDAVESIAVILRHRYLLGYEPSPGKQGWRTIRVDVDRPAATARTRQGYYSGS